MEGGEKIDASLRVAIIIGIVNFLALLVVAWQTYLSRKSVQISEGNLLESQQSKELSNLPRAYSIISVQNYLEWWMADLKLLIDNEKEIRQLIKTSKSDIKIGTEHWGGKVKGLVPKSLFNTLPDWLAQILIAGAQYYSETMSLTGMISSYEHEQQMRLSLLNATIERAKDGTAAIDQMLASINRLVPRWYLECPASLNDSDFFE